MSTQPSGVLVGKDESGKYNGDHGWSASHEDDGSSESAPLWLDGAVVALVVLHHKSLWANLSTKNDAHARRLVACWNACDGISTTTLEINKVQALIDSTVKVPAVGLNTYDPNISWAKHTVEITYQMWEYSTTVLVTVTGNCKGESILRSAIGIHADEIYTQQGDDAELILRRPAKDGNSDDTLETCPEDDDLEHWLENMCVGLKIVVHTEEVKS